MAVPNAALAYLITDQHGDFSDSTQDIAKHARSILTVFTSVLTYILYGRARNAYSRWWEGGTLLQQTRGEWFNSYSSLLAFVTGDSQREEEVEAYQHMLARVMSLLFCYALQQVSPNQDRVFEILDSEGLDQPSLDFMHESNDKVEVILQWVQRSTISNMQNGVIPTAPPVVSRAFQELSRGIVNLQNARKIADFPYPFPYAQAISVMLLLHWAMCPILSSIMLNSRIWAAMIAFFVTFFLWCINFIALELERPFGSGDNDLPMEQMQNDFNQSIATLLCKTGNQPPVFHYEPQKHWKMERTMWTGGYLDPGGSEDASER